MKNGIKLLIVICKFIKFVPFNKIPLKLYDRVADSDWHNAE